MSSRVRCLLFLFLTIGFAKASFAQDTTLDQSRGEIIMTKGQLQSFLSTIAKLKKQQIARQEEARLQQKESMLNRMEQVPSSDDFQNNFTQSGKYGTLENHEPGYSFDAYQQKLMSQLELMNARLNSVISELELLKIKLALNENSDFSSGELLRPGMNQQQPQVRMEPKQQPVIINQETPSQPYINYVPQPIISTDAKGKYSSQATMPEYSALVKSQQEEGALKNRINAMEEQLQMLQQLLEGSDENEKKNYHKKISSLSAKIDSLNTHLIQNSKDADSINSKSQSRLLHILNDFSYNVYFENNATKIPSSDYSKLQEVINIARKNPQATVVLRGFASKAGNPQYNEKISFQRALSVKNWLLENGLGNRRIITMHHGVDKSVDASRARRVEITFRTR